MISRKLALFPLMAATALSLTLAACDENSGNDQTSQNEAAAVAPAASGDPMPVTQAETSVMPDATRGVINAEGANSFATAEGAQTGAIFLTLHNPGTSADRLVGARTDVAGTVELHESMVDDQGMMQMRRVDGIVIEPGQQVVLKPGGYHIMLMGLTKPLAEGETYDVTLDFETADDVTLPVTVVAPGAGAAAMPMNHDSMDHGDMHGSGMTDSATTGGEEATPSPDDEATPPPSDVPASDEPVTQ